MRVEDVFILPDDVDLVPLDSLPRERRKELGGAEGDVAITRLRGRAHSKLLDADTARLVEEFREGRTIVDAVLRFTAATRGDPESTLEAVYPLLERLITSNFLAPKDSSHAAPVEESLEAGSGWAGFVVKAPVQILEDTEIYRVEDARGGRVALKVARWADSDRGTDPFEREARLLEHIAGSVSPRLVDRGVFQERRYLAIEWCEGVDASRAAARFRSNHSTEGRRQLLALACSITEAYATLHGLGVLHGDVHPGNLIVAEDGSVRILDFGLARLVTADDPGLARAPRGGLGYFFEPEYAAAFLAEAPRAPQTTFAGEQHVLAHVLYQVLTGDGYSRFSTEESECMRQLAESRPLPFEQRGVDPWPDVERALGRALDPEPSMRFDSVAAFARELRRAEIPERPPREMAPPRPTSSELSQARVDDYVVRFDPSGRLFESGVEPRPYSSVTFGSAGVACFLYRLALVRGDARLLSWAKLWIERAILEIDQRGESAFTDPEHQLSRETIGPIALYHTETGLWAVQALIAHAMGDVRGQADAVSSFLSAADRPCDNIDLTLGSSGVLLGAALLHEAMPETERLRELGGRLSRLIWEELAAKPPISVEQPFGLLGIAHGWAGALYALLRWSRSGGWEPPPDLGWRLRELAALAEQDRAGVRWSRMVRPPERLDPRDYDRSWCNGTGGMIHLWTLAHRVYGEEAWLELAEGAAWNVIESAEPIDQLCCGRPGQTYGVLNLFKHTGDERWLRYARQMAEECLRLSGAPSSIETPYPYALYKGPIGSALLSAEFEDPERACMPLFESEGWSVD